VKTEQKKNRSVFEKSIAALFDKGITEAYLFMAKNSDAGGDKQDEYLQLKDLLDSAMGVDDVITKSIENQIDQTVEIELKTGKVKIHITSVKNGKIIHTKRVGRANITESIPITDLSDRERAKRIGDDINGLALTMGLRALQGNMFEDAKMYLGTIPSPLKESLTEIIDARQKAYLVVIYTTQLELALRMAGIESISRTNLKKNLEMLKKSELTTGMRFLLYGSAKDVWRQARKTDWIKEHDTVALIKYMLSLNPVNDIESEDVDEGGDNSQDVDENTEEKDNANIDWREEIDF
jgi:hypothetical protein